MSEGLEPAFPVSAPRARTEADRLASRRAKQRRRGVCGDCGAETRYNGTPTAANDGTSRYCPKCSISHRKPPQPGVFQRKLYALISQGVTRFSDLAEALEEPKPALAARLTHELQRGHVVRVSRGIYALNRGET